MEYKLIAFDMDGTLLTTDKHISPATAQAIEKAAKQGKHIAIASGRCFPELDEVFEFAPAVRYIIINNGALVYDLQEKKEILLDAIDVETVYELFRRTNNRDIMMHILDYKCVLEREKVDNVERYHMEPYKPMYDKVATVVDSLYDYYKENETPIQKINFYHTVVKDREQTIQEFSDLPLRLTQAESASLECNSPTASKWVGLQKLCEYLNISTDECIAVGDGYNDLELLKNAGFSIAMENAVQDVKDVCDVIVSDNDHDGCVEAIEKYLLD